MTEHSVMTFAAGLSTRLAPRSRHVGVFLGAGSSKSCGLPDITQLTSGVQSTLAGAALEQFKSLLTDRNLEEALTRLRRISAVAGKESIGGLDADQATNLDRLICAAIIDQLTKPPASLRPALHFGAWVARATYARPVELFTVNYDLLLETALESWGVPYFDGFVGTINARFRPDLVESRLSDDDQSIPSFFARIWKLHGSANWAWASEDPAEVRRLGRPIGGEEIAAIYPSDAKYDQSRRMPFVVLQDRLRHALNEPETLMLVTGYSWGDDHINEVFFEAAIRRPRSEIIAFCYGEIPEKLAETAEVTPNLQVVSPAEAIIGGQRGPWKVSESDELDGIWADDKFQLGDFARLSAFLARGAMPDVRLEEHIVAMLATKVRVDA